MTRSFWGFGYSQPSQPQQPQQQQRQPKDAMIPPNGTFAPATTAVTQTVPDFSQDTFGAGGAGGAGGNSSGASGNPSGAIGATGASTAGSSAAAAGAASAFRAQQQQSTKPSHNINFASTPHQSMLHGPGGSARGKINIPETAHIQGKLRVRVLEAQGLDTNSPNSNPYIVVQCSTSEHISRSANTASVQDSGIAIPSHSTSRLNLPAAANAAKGNAAGAGAGANGANAAGVNPSNPKWEDEEAIFDVTSYNSDLEVTLYDQGDNDRFLGFARIRPDFKQTRVFDAWHTLETATGDSHNGTLGRIRVSLRFERIAQQQFGPSDFQVLRLIGKGTFGQVYQVRKRDSSRVYAMKVLSKRVIVREKEIAHTIGERDILVRTSGEGSNFLVGLKFSFQTSNDLYLVTDYMSGGELFWHLQREGRFSEQRAKFYIAELIVALEHLHYNDIVYRDLKPENILLDAAGHVALCDFGLSKAHLHSNTTTNTFCGTTEYLAPEVLLDDKGYTKMVDFWSLGVLIFEMCCGWSPFYAEDSQQMYKNIAFGKVRFPKDALSPEGRDFVKGLLNRNPKHRLGATHDARELMAHPFFKDVDWDMLKKKQIQPPYKPHVSSDDDISNFDPEFTNASTSVLTRNMEAGSTPLSPGIQDKFKGFTFVDDTLMDEYFKGSKSGANAGAVPASYRAPPPNMGRDEGIDLYDENELKLSHSHYDSGIKNKFANAPPSKTNNSNLSKMDEEEDADMMDEEFDKNDYDDFVEGQGFEM